MISRRKRRIGFKNEHDEAYGDAIHPMITPIILISVLIITPSSSPLIISSSWLRSCAISSWLRPVPVIPTCCCCCLQILPSFWSLSLLLSFFLAARGWEDVSKNHMILLEEWSPHFGDEERNHNHQIALWSAPEVVCLSTSLSFCHSSWSSSSSFHPIKN